MSLPWRERLRFVLGPREVLRWHRASAVRGARVETLALPVAPAGPGPAWRAALATLSQSLAAAPTAHGTPVQVVLSNHFVRYAAAPWREDLASAAERDAYVRHLFEQTFGEAARDWVVRESPTPHRCASIACAVDQGLIDGLRKTFSAQRLACEAIEPLFMFAFNAFRGALASPGCLLVHEPGRLAGGVFGAREWRGVFCVRAGETLAPTDVERELLLNGVPANARVFAYSPDAAGPATAGGWPLRALALPPRTDAGTIDAVAGSAA